MIGGQCGHLPFNGSCMQMILEVASKHTYCPRSPDSDSLYTSQIMSYKCSKM